MLHDNNTRMIQVSAMKLLRIQIHDIRRTRIKWYTI